MLPRMTVTSTLAGLAGFESGTTARSGACSFSLAAWATAQPHVPAAIRARTVMFAILLFMFSSSSVQDVDFDLLAIRMSPLSVSSLISGPPLPARTPLKPSLR